jgi:hypothetical protein
MHVEKRGNSLIVDGRQVVTFDSAIADTVQLDRIVVVLTEPTRGEDCTRNVYGISPEGEMLWQIQAVHPNSHQPNTYTGFIFRDRSASSVWIANWSGMSAEIDPRSGEILALEESR